MSVRGRWDSRARWEDVTMTRASLSDEQPLTWRSGKGRCGHPKLVCVPNGCSHVHFTARVFSSVSFIGWTCPGRPRMRRKRWGMCAGQRWPVLEYSGRFMGSTNLKAGGHMLPLLHAAGNTYALRRESDATRWIPAC